MHWQARCRARCLKFVLNHYLHPFYVCVSSKDSGEAAYMHPQSEHGLMKYSIRIKSRMSWPIYLLSNHFLIKSSRSYLFFRSKIVSMIRKYHYHKLQTTPWHREEEQLNNHETPGRQIKKSNQLSLPHQDDCNTRTDIK